MVGIFDSHPKTGPMVWKWSKKPLLVPYWDDPITILNTGHGSSFWAVTLKIKKLDHSFQYLDCLTWNKYKDVIKPANLEWQMGGGLEISEFEWRHLLMAPNTDTLFRSTPDPLRRTCGWHDQLLEPGLPFQRILSGPCRGSRDPNHPWSSPVRSDLQIPDQSWRK